MIFLTLLFEFAKIGLFTFGGGMATLPLLIELGERTGWYGSSFVTEMVAISQSTPGPIGLNMATYIGYQVGSGAAVSSGAASSAATGAAVSSGAAATTAATSFGQVALGILGAVVASIGIALPCIIIATIVGKFLSKYSNNKTIQNMFQGIRPVVVGLILAAAWAIAQQVLWVSSADGTSSIFSFTKLIFFVIIFAVALLWKKHPVFLILISAVAGIALGL